MNQAIHIYSLCLSPPMIRNRILSPTSSSREEKGQEQIELISIMADDEVSMQMPEVWGLESF